MAHKVAASHCPLVFPRATYFVLYHVAHLEDFRSFSAVILRVDLSRPTSLVPSGIQIGANNNNAYLTKRP